jgi:hypothetical protein
MSTPNNEFVRRLYDKLVELWIKHNGHATVPVVRRSIKDPKEFREYVDEAVKLMCDDARPCVCEHRLLESIVTFQQT